MISVTVCLTLRWTETGPLLRWARVPLLCPYFALGLDFATYAWARASDPGLESRSSLGKQWSRDYPAIDATESRNIYAPRC